MRMVRDFGMAREVRDGAKAAAEPTSRASAMMVPRMVMEEEEAKSDVGVRSAHASNACMPWTRNELGLVAVTSGGITQHEELPYAQFFSPLNCR